MSIASGRPSENWFVPSMYPTISRVNQSVFKPSKNVFGGSHGQRFAASAAICIQRRERSERSGRASMSAAAFAKASWISCTVSRPTSAVSSCFFPCGSFFGHLASAAATSARTPPKPLARIVRNGGTWCMSSENGPQQSASASRLRAQSTRNSSSGTSACSL